MGIFSRLFGSNKKEKINVLGADKLSFLEVDMHNHLLPAIDDGSKSIQDSISLIKGLNGLGLSKFVCTPHVMEGIHPNTKSSISKAHEELSSALTTVGSSTEIHYAAEHMIDGGLADIISRNELCLLPGGYVLIEMSYLAESHALFQTIFDIQNLGYKPILAHPERYNYFHPTFEKYKQIKDAGCFLQLNLLSISRYYGVDVKATALSLLKSGMYDFVGTDLHHERHLSSLQALAAKYPIREMLGNCNILNPSLLDSMKGQSTFVIE